MVIVRNAHEGQRLTDDVIAVDVETTGFSPKWCEIIELAAVRVHDGAVANSYASLVRPSKKIPYQIRRLTGIDDTMVEGAPSIELVMDGFLRFCGETRVIVAHNSPFDFGFIRPHLVSPEEFTTVDTCVMARQFLPELKHHKLSDVVEALGVAKSRFHRAKADAEMAALCYLKFVDMLRDKGIEQLTELN